MPSRHPEFTLPANSRTCGDSCTALHWADCPGVTPPAHAGPDDLPTGTDVISTVSGATVTQLHRSTGVPSTVTIPSGQTYRAASGWSVLTQDSAGAPHVLRAASDGTTADLPVTGLPTGAQLTGSFVTGASTAAAVRASWNGESESGVHVPRGTYTWKLTAEPRDGQGPDLTLTGTTTVN